jgi:CheY-like chemotaxis protein
MAGCKVLVIDNQDEIRGFLTTAAAEWCAVDAVGSAAEARAALARTDYQIAILNAALPDADGVALAQQARHRGWVVIVIPHQPLDRHRLLDLIDRVSGKSAAKREATRWQASPSSPASVMNNPCWLQLDFLPAHRTAVDVSDSIMFQHVASGSREVCPFERGGTVTVQQLLSRSLACQLRSFPSVSTHEAFRHRICVSPFHATSIAALQQWCQICRQPARFFEVCSAA